MRLKYRHICSSLSTTPSSTKSCSKREGAARTSCGTRLRGNRTSWTLWTTSRGPLNAQAVPTTSTCVDSFSRSSTGRTWACRTSTAPSGSTTATRYSSRTGPAANELSTSWMSHSQTSSKRSHSVRPTSTCCWTRPSSCAN